MSDILKQVEKAIQDYEDLGDGDYSCGKEAFYEGDLFKSKHWKGEKPVRCTDETAAEPYAVWHFQEADVYLRINGFYSSYDGNSFDDPVYKVKPIQKTITVFE